MSALAGYLVADWRHRPGLADEPAPWHGTPRYDPGPYVTCRAVGCHNRAMRRGRGAGYCPEHRRRP